MNCEIGIFLHWYVVVLIWYVSFLALVNFAMTLPFFNFSALVSFLIYIFCNCIFIICALRNLYFLVIASSVIDIFWHAYFLSLVCWAIFFFLIYILAILFP